MGKLFDMKMIVGVASAIALATVVVTPLLAFVIVKVRMMANGTPTTAQGGE